MKKLLVLGLIALLLFGCPGQEQTLPEQQPADGTPAGEETANGETPATTEEPEDTGSDFQGKGFEELASLGLPVECTVTVTDPQSGQVMTSKMYMKGENFRSETTLPQEQGMECSKMISVMVDEKFYWSCEDGEVMPGYDWVMIDMSQIETEEGETDSEFAQGSYSAEYYEDLPETSFSCVPGVFGDEKFAVSGKIYDMTELLTQMQDYDFPEQ